MDEDDDLDYAELERQALSQESTPDMPRKKKAASTAAVDASTASAAANDAATAGTASPSSSHTQTISEMAVKGQASVVADGARYVRSS